MMQKNPWLEIPALDYEGHMSDGNVGQLAALSALFGEAYDELKPTRLLVLGVATGNGLEHVRPAVTARVVGVDLNPDYLALARQRFAAQLPGLELIVGDVGEVDLPRGEFDWISAALLFEYVDPAACLGRIAPWLAPDGALDVVLQLPSAKAPPVTPTRFASLGKLASHICLVSPEELRRAAGTVGLSSKAHRTVPLPGSKALHVERFSTPR